MKKIFISSLILASFISVSQSGYSFKKKIFGYTLDQITLMTDDGDSKLYIDDLLFKMFNPDSTVSDFELAMGYYGFVLQPDYKPDKYIGLEMQVMALNNNHRWEKAKRYADSLITNYPTCLMGHVELSYACNSLQDTNQAALYRNIYERLGNMIFKTGDGLSIKTAYLVTGYKDIEVLTQMMRMKIKKRKTKTKRKSTFEIVTVFKNLEKKKIYFDTSLITEFKR
jgi:hypothetical protein